MKTLLNTRILYSGKSIMKTNIIVQRIKHIFKSKKVNNRVNIM